MPKPKSNKRGGSRASSATRPRKHGPSPHCRYCTAKLPRHKPQPIKFCNAQCEAKYV